MTFKEDFAFQAHAIQNHVQSKTLFNEVPKVENVDPEPVIDLKEEVGDDNEECFDEVNEHNDNAGDGNFLDRGNNKSQPCCDKFFKSVFMGV